LGEAGAMIDFPASPTVGQIFTDPTTSLEYTWDGVKWVAGGLANAPFLPLLGGTLSGALTIAEAASSNLILDKAASGNAATINGQMNGVTRWHLNLGNSTPETGANTGSDLAVVRYSDAGALVDTPLTINRASGQVTVPNLNPSPLGDNRIINGDMRVDQRNNGASGGGGATASMYTIDRWYYSATQPTKVTWGRNLNAATGPVGFPYYFGFQSSSAYTPTATDNFWLVQYIEADMVSDFAWGTANAQPVTLSFWAQSSLTGTFNGSFMLGKSGARTYLFPFSIPAANTWTKVVITIPGDTAGTWAMSGNGAALGLIFSMGVGANLLGPPNVWSSSPFIGVTGAVNLVATNGATFYVTGVKLEVGNIATPFNRQSMAKSLADCQRYYQQTALTLISGNVAAGNLFNGTTVFYPVQMRASPTITPSGQVYNNASGLAIGLTDVASVRMAATMTATGYGSAAANLTISAEL
jgi:hypothetical protein